MQMGPTWGEPASPFPALLRPTPAFLRSPGGPGSTHPSSAHLDQFLCWVWALACSSVEGIQTEINTKNTPGAQTCLSQNGMPPGQLRFLRVPLSPRPAKVGTESRNCRNMENDQGAERPSRQARFWDCYPAGPLSSLLWALLRRPKSSPDP